MFVRDPTGLFILMVAFPLFSESLVTTRTDVDAAHYLGPELCAHPPPLFNIRYKVRYSEPAVNCEYRYGITLA